MRDAFGGAFMIKIFLIFIIVYVCFTALALNYAKAFKVKNAIIDYLEDEEIGSIKNMSADNLTAMEDYFANEIFGKMNYNVTMKCTNEYSYCKNGIKIEQKSGGKRYGSDTVYYKVTTKVGWSIPFINKILAINDTDEGANVTSGNWTISGETRIIIPKS